MEFLIAIAIIAAIFIAGFSVGAKLAQTAAKSSTGFASDDVLVAQAHDRNNLLNTWRREIANILVWRDPDRYLNLYRTLHTETSAYKSWKSAALQAKFDELCKKHPNYEDFDAFRTRLHVLYPDARSWQSDEELEAKFSDITRFQAILCTKDHKWRLFAAVSESDIQHLSEYVLKIRDTKFRLRLERAISDYYVWRAGKETETMDAEAEMMDVYEYGGTTVRHVHHFAENRYGIHFKDTNEFGLYTFFVFDDGRISHSYYRSDQTFEVNDVLDVLHSVADDCRMKSQREPVA